MKVGLTAIGLLIAVAGFADCGLAHADEDLRQALALERSFQKIIDRAEPAIACILVSRSEGYRKYASIPPSEVPGQLGTFEPSSLNNNAKQLSPEALDQLRRRLDLADPQVVPESFGSGVVLDARGLILTNYHVVRDAVKIYARLPGGKASYADIHAADPRSDLAVLRVLNDKITPLLTLPRGDATELKRGQFVLSLANPFAAGFRDGQPSASWGILSNIRRRSPGQTLRETERVKPLHHYGVLLQTDARLNLGCSGGAILNLKGELVGLSTALAAIHGGETPGGFAVPLDIGINRILDVLVRGEEVEYGFLGVAFHDRERAEPGPGVLVSFVTPGSPADLDARLRPQDRILAVDGVLVNDSDDLFLHLGTRLAGSKVRLDVRRAFGGDQAVHATLAKFYVPGPKIASSLGKRPFVKGLRVDHASLLAQQQPQWQRMPAGVLIAEVAPNSPAANAGLKAGEVITHVGSKLVTTPAAFYDAVGLGPFEVTLFSHNPGAAPTRATLR